MRPPGMKRQTTMSCGPNRSSDRSAHARAFIALLTGEEPALHGGTEAAAEQVAEVVAGEGARRHEADEQRDARVGAPRGGDAERDDRRLARHQGKDRVKGRQQEGDEVRDRRINLQAV